MCSSDLQPISIPGEITAGVGQVLETDTAQPIGYPIARLISQAFEVDQAFQLGKAIQINQVTETDAAMGATSMKGLTIGQVLETDTPITISPQKLKSLGLVTETDLAQLIDVISAAISVLVITADIDLYLAVGGDIGLSPTALSDPIDADVSIYPAAGAAADVYNAVGGDPDALPLVEGGIDVRPP